MANRKYAKIVFCFFVQLKHLQAKNLTLKVGQIFLRGFLSSVKFFEMWPKVFEAKELRDMNNLKQQVAGIRLNGISPPAWRKSFKFFG